MAKKNKKPHGAEAGDQNPSSATGATVASPPEPAHASKANAPLGKAPVASNQKEHVKEGSDSKKLKTEQQQQQQEPPQQQQKAEQLKTSAGAQQEKEKKEKEEVAEKSSVKPMSDTESDSEDAGDTGTGAIGARDEKKSAKNKKKREKRKAKLKAGNGDDATTNPTSGAATVPHMTNGTLKGEVHADEGTSQVRTTGVADEKAPAEVAEALPQPASPSPPGATTAPDSPSPLALPPRYDWYETDTHATLAAYVKDQKGSDVVVRIEALQTLHASFSNCDLSLKLFETVDPHVEVKILSSKVEIKVKKLSPGRWGTLLTLEDKSPPASKINSPSLTPLPHESQTDKVADSTERSRVPTYEEAMSSPLEPPRNGLNHFGKDKELRSFFSTLDMGLKGLENLGNTCYMNSIIQSLSSTKVLTDHFLQDRYLEEINESNPLGMQGKVALQFGKLLKKIWNPDDATYISPSELKEVIGKFRPQFQGYQQHDSQELLAFLLDGLHEDLNRVIKKPYTENPEYTNQTDKAFAAICWNNYKKRNDSVIVDHFQGQYKSKLTCQTCSRVSITFDPFMYLSVPIPTPKRLVFVTMVEKASYNFPIKYGIKVPRQGTVIDVIKELSRLSGIDSNRILMTEVYRNKFQKIFRDDDGVENLPNEPDSLFAYELATKNDDDPQFALVPIVLRKLGCNATHCANCGKTAKDGGCVIKRCTKCKEIGYCSQECQAADWPTHKLTCRPMYTPFGIPFLLSIPRKNTTYKQLSVAVWGSLRRFIHFQKEKNPNSSNLFARPLFQLRYLEGMKRETLLDNSEQTPLDFDYSVVISADWEANEVENFFGEALKDEIRKHESVDQPVDDGPVFLQDCIRLFSEEEVLEDSDSWYCPQCKALQPARKQLTLWSLPKVLVLHLKRFASAKKTTGFEGMLSRFGLLRAKLNTLVDFPLEGLDMTEFVGHSTEGKRPIYDLFAVSNHYGGTYGGHYTAFCLREKKRDDGTVEKQWFKFDDSRVSALHPEDIVSPSAYVLFLQLRE